MSLEIKKSKDGPASHPLQEIGSSNRDIFVSEIEIQLLYQIFVSEIFVTQVLQSAFGISEARPDGNRKTRLLQLVFGSFLLRNQRKNRQNQRTNRKWEVKSELGSSVQSILCAPISDEKILCVSICDEKSD